MASDATYYTPCELCGLRYALWLGMNDEHPICYECLQGQITKLDHIDTHLRFEQKYEDKQQWAQ